MASKAMRSPVRRGLVLSQAAKDNAKLKKIAIDKGFGLMIMTLSKQKLDYGGHYRL
jgi:hypothetical protein